MQFEGSGQVSGGFRGKVSSQDVLVVGDRARVFGRIEADVVVIFGHVEGDVFASQRVAIHRPAIVRGTIHTSDLQVEQGAVFDGKTKPPQRMN